MANEVNSSFSLVLPLGAETVAIVRYRHLTIAHYYEKRKMINENGKI
jgi:hypothetical protein